VPPRAADNDTDTTMVVLGHSVDRTDRNQADPEGVTTHAARRSVLGGVVALHVDDPEAVDAARQAVPSGERVRVFDVDDQGKPVA
jgi:hypothetical protein